MNQIDFLAVTELAEKLKCTTRHSDTSTGRRESVAEHCWRLSLMAMLCGEDFPDTDINRVIKMCIIHDLGEVFTGDIATFEKTDAHSEQEKQMLCTWIDTLPEYQRDEFSSLINEMNALETKEAKLYKALDKLEAVIQHNESDISSWLELEYELQLTYGEEEVAFSEYLVKLKEIIDSRTREKIEKEGKKSPC